jgi:hypothetical protein
MRGLKIPLLGCLVVMSLAGALTGCTNPGSGYGADSTQGMVGGKGPGYNKD